MPLIKMMITGLVIAIEIKCLYKELEVFRALIAYIKLSGIGSTK